MLTLAAASTELTAGYGMYLVQTTLALLAVSALAVLSLRLLRRRSATSSRALRVVAQLTLEPRRSIYVVEAAGRFLLVGVGEGPMSLLAELDAAKVAELDRPGVASPGIVDLVRRILGKSGSAE